MNNGKGLAMMENVKSLLALQKERGLSLLEIKGELENNPFQNQTMDFINVDALGQKLSGQLSQDAKLPLEDQNSTEAQNNVD